MFYYTKDVLVPVLTSVSVHYAYLLDIFKVYCVNQWEIHNSGLCLNQLQQLFWIAYTRSDFVIINSLL